jgi:hypothetical protein
MGMVPVSLRVARRTHLTVRSVVRVQDHAHPQRSSHRCTSAHSPGDKPEATGAGAGSALRWLCAGVVEPFVHQSATVRVVCITAIVTVALVRFLLLPRTPVPRSRRQVYMPPNRHQRQASGEQVGSATAAALWLRDIATTTADTAHVACIARARNLLRQLASSSSASQDRRPTLPAAARASSVDQAHRLLLCGCFQQLLDCEQVIPDQKVVSSETTFAPCLPLGHRQ